MEGIIGLTQEEIDEDVEDAVNNSGLPEIGEMEEFVSKHYDYFRNSV
jgi:hypothetical protein